MNTLNEDGQYFNDGYSGAQMHAFDQEENADKQLIEEESKENAYDDGNYYRANQNQAVLIEEKKPAKLTFHGYSRSQSVIEPPRHDSN